MEDYEKKFESLRFRMDNVLSQTYDLGQINALDTLISAVDAKMWDQITYEKVVTLRDKLVDKYQRSYEDSEKGEESS